MTEPVKPDIADLTEGVLHGHPVVYDGRTSILWRLSGDAGADAQVYRNILADRKTKGKE